MTTTPSDNNSPKGAFAGTALIAMSGGVDSSVTGYLMQQAGYDCHGLTMVLFDRTEPPESGESPKTQALSQDAIDAAAAAARLGMPHQTVDLREAFHREIIDYFINTYEAGDTPNPCVLCNRKIKFGELLRLADEQGLHYLATGHYARVGYDEDRGRYVLRKAADPAKDQSYVLYGLTQEQLSRIVLPLGEYTKDQVRAIAAEQGFANAQKAESQDICFIPDGDYAAFIARETGKEPKPGDYLDESGRVIGTHQGALRYTKGQRKGLGIALGAPAYVLDKDMEANTVTIGGEEALFETHATIEGVNWILPPEIDGAFRAMAMTRYRKKEAAATITLLSGNRAQVVFDEPQRAMTRGQSMVFYDRDLVLGGGIICDTAK